MLFSLVGKIDSGSLSSCIDVQLGQTYSQGDPRSVPFVLDDSLIP